MAYYSFGGKVRQKGVMKSSFAGGEKVLGQKLSRNGNLGSEKGRRDNLPANLSYLGGGDLGVVASSKSQQEEQGWD